MENNPKENVEGAAWPCFVWFCVIAVVAYYSKRWEKRGKLKGNLIKMKLKLDDLGISQPIQMGENGTTAPDLLLENCALQRTMLCLDNHLLKRLSMWQMGPLKHLSRNKGQRWNYTGKLYEDSSVSWCTSPCHPWKIHKIFENVIPVEALPTEPTRTELW